MTFYRVNNTVRFCPSRSQFLALRKNANQMKDDLSVCLRSKSDVSNQAKKRKSGTYLHVDVSNCSMGSRRAFCERLRPGNTVILPISTTKVLKGQDIGEIIGIWDLPTYVSV